jgi:hypothetical protein
MTLLSTQFSKSYETNREPVYLKVVQSEASVLTTVRYVNTRSLMMSIFFNL